jgi:peptidoglycan/xylan/chitin deacetylase (PgdA/CDA1 family)
MRPFRMAALAQKIELRMHARPARVAWPNGVISFTFDDVPKSAVAAGGSILERYGARGTYYVSMNLAGTVGSVGPMFDDADIQSAHRSGHEIGCHTHTHLDCCASAKASILAAVRHNAAAVSSVIEGFVPTNFAYPYGRVSPMAKRLLGPRFSSCRGICKGINHGTIDLADLRATAVYDSKFDEAEMRHLIDENRSVGGWLIFYTHDVVDAPSPFGCKPAQLGGLVGYAAKRATILPVRDVVARLHPLRAIPRAVYKAIPRRV